MNDRELGNFVLEKGDAPNESKIKIPGDKMGVPGTHRVTIIATHSSQDSDPRSALDDKSVRKFTCLAILSKKHVWLETIDGTENLDQAGSFLTTKDDSDKPFVNSKSGKIFFEKNSNSEICKASCEIETTSIHQARFLFSESLIPVLDFICVRANVPILVEKIHIKDTKNSLQSFDTTWPYQKKVLPPEILWVEDELASAYALFRESKNNISPYYKFLCHYKIMESMYKKIRPDFFTKAKREKIEITKTKELVPDHPDILNWHKEFIGKPISTLFQNELTKDYRNAIAHFLLNDGNFINISRGEIRGKYDKIVSVSEICAFILITNQEKMFEEYRSKKNAPP